MSGHNCLHLAGLGALLIALSSGCIEKRSFQPVIPPPPSVPTARLPQNNAYLGSVHSPRPGALQPRFAWTAATTDEDDPLTYKLELSANRDFSGEVFEYTTEDTSFSPPSPLAVSTVPPVGRRYFWRVRACLPLICSEPSAVRWINLGRSDHDYNGDGYADVLVGAPNDDGNGQDAGRAYVYFGGPGTTLDSTPDGVLAPGNAGDVFGEAVAAIGDFDGDGYADIAAGASYRFSRGVAFVFFGGFGPTFDPTPDVVLGDGGSYFAFGRSIAAVGDVNGDGYDDVLVGAPDELTNSSPGSAYLYFGNAEGKKGTAVSFDSRLTNRHLGDHVSAIGDLNGDGLADFSISDATLFLNGASDCHAYLYLGRTTWTNNPPPDDEAVFRRMGCRLNIDAAGDVNQDGYSDVLQAGGDATHGGFVGATVTLLLGTAEPKWPTRSLFITNDGKSIASLQDVNGDSFPDFAVSSGVATTLHLFFGAERLASPLPPTVSLSAQPDRFAQTISGIGDSNGDGLNDIVIGDPSFSSGKGTAYVYFGLADPGIKFEFSADGTLDAGATSAAFGYAVASLDAVQRRRELPTVYRRRKD